MLAWIHRGCMPVVPVVCAGFSYHRYIMAAYLQYKQNVWALGTLDALWLCPCSANSMHFLQLPLIYYGCVPAVATVCGLRLPWIHCTCVTVVSIVCAGSSYLLFVMVASFQFQPECMGSGYLGYSVAVFLQYHQYVFAPVTLHIL
jgi:hypothetical protein